MNLERIYSTQVDLAKPDESVRVAAQRMAARNVGCLVIVDDEEHPVGIVTDRDLALSVLGRSVDPDDVTVGDVMTAHPLCVRHDAATTEAIEAMSRKGVRRLPVVGAGGRLVGLVALDDVLLHMTIELEAVRRLLHKESPQSMAHT